MFVIGIIAGAIIQIALANSRRNRILKNARTEADEIRKKAQEDAVAVRKEAKVEAQDKYFTMMKEFEAETKEKKEELQKLEIRTMKREENLEKKQSFLDKKDRALSIRQKEIQNRESKLELLETKRRELVTEQEKVLERIAGMTQQEAKNVLIEKMENEAKRDAADRIKKLLDEAEEAAELKAKEIISTAIQRLSSDFVSESTVSVVDLPNDEMKGRIIGREGRNIRALEAATGIDLIIDDTPEAVILSGFDAIRREVAATSLKRLISDGRIHPGRIEEIVRKVEKEIEKNIIETGEQAAFEVGVQGLHRDILKLLGRLKYRTSYGQNVLQHSKEVAFIAGIMAAELGINVKLAKRAGLLHDIGKAVDHEIEGSHAVIGADLAKKFKEPKAVIQAIKSHHGDDMPTTIEAVLIQSADALSAARPGARREILETYLKRLEKLEEIANEFPGVEKTYAIQAGREIRIIFRPQEISDQEMSITAREIAQRIEGELEYPGEIKVTAIRESRSVEYAR